MGTCTVNVRINVSAVCPNLCPLKLKFNSIQSFNGSRITITRQGEGNNG